MLCGLAYPVRCSVDVSCRAEPELAHDRLRLQTFPMCMNHATIADFVCYCSTPTYLQTIPLPCVQALKPSHVLPGAHPGRALIPILNNVHRPECSHVKQSVELADKSDGSSRIKRCMTAATCYKI